jgi:ribosomal protein S18 acetylase RimI-like enzyme
LEARVVLQVVRASAADTDALFALQQLAFERIAIRANLPAIPPMAETVSELRQDFATSTILKALWQEDLVGAVRGTLRGNVCHISRMAVHPEHQGKGIGSALLAKIEHSFSGVAAFELFTHSQNVEALALYERRGYHVTRRETIPGSGPMVFMAKVVNVIQ